MAEKKPKTLSRIIEKLTEATAMVNTLELALAGMEELSADIQAARDLRMTAYSTVKRLRKIEQQMYALATADLDLPPEVRAILNELDKEGAHD